MRLHRIAGVIVALLLRILGGFFRLRVFLVKIVDYLLRVVDYFQKLMAVHSQLFGISWFDSELFLVRYWLGTRFCTVLFAYRCVLRGFFAMLDQKKTVLGWFSAVFPAIRTF